MQFQLAQACWPDKYEDPGVSSPDTYKIPHFYVDNKPPPSGPYAPQEATLRTSSHTPVPPGRYVVTVRVTDRSITSGGVAAGDGLYFEWDIPIIINGPFSQTINSGLFEWDDKWPSPDTRWWYDNDVSTPPASGFYPNPYNNDLFKNGLGDSPWAGSGGL